MIQFSNFEFPQSRNLLRKGLRGGEEKHRANIKKKNRGKVEYFVGLHFFIRWKNDLLDGGQDQDFPDSHDARTEAATIATSREGGLCRKEGLEQAGRRSPWLLSSIRIICG